MHRLRKHALAPVFIAVLLTLSAGCFFGDRKGVAGKTSGAKAVTDLKARVAKDNLYPWTTIDRLAFYAWRTTDEHVFVQISEIHRGDDGADPNTHPTVDFWRLNRRTGQWEVEWPVPGEGSINYKLYRSKLKNGLSWEWACNEDPYGVVHIWDQKDEFPPKLIVFRNGEQIYAYDVRYLKGGLVMGPFLGLAYDDFADRAGKPQPIPFDDVLGNGWPDLVISEYVLRGGVPESMLTVISLDGTNVVETPAVHCRGEIMYFKDFDGDGTMEIINTDWERGFRKFDSNGVPLHKSVWQFDREAGRYQETGTEDPDAPGTWPAYREEASREVTPPARVPADRWTDRNPYAGFPTFGSVPAGWNSSSFPFRR